MRKWIAVVVLLVVAGTAAFLWSRGGQTAPRAAVFRGEPTTAHYDPIATRALDPEPLTVAEIFPGGSVSSGTSTPAAEGNAGSDPAMAEGNAGTDKPTDTAMAEGNAGANTPAAEEKAGTDPAMAEGNAGANTPAAEGDASTGIGIESLVVSPVTLTIKGTEALTDCAQAVWGSAEDAVAGCTQVLRAHYATPDGQISGQFLIFNLADSAAADKLVAAFGSGGFVRLAPGTPAGFDGSHSWAQARALGHYVTLSWVGPVVPGSQVDLTASQVAVDGLSLVIQRRLVR
jgi:hypothetical protein